MLHAKISKMKRCFWIPHLGHLKMLIFRNPLIISLNFGMKNRQKKSQVIPKIR